MMVRELISINVRVRRVDEQVLHRVDGRIALYTMQSLQKRGNMLMYLLIIHLCKDYG
jgi:hypothetical protein